MEISRVERRKRKKQSLKNNNKVKGVATFVQLSVAFGRIAAFLKFLFENGIFPK